MGSQVKKLNRPPFGPQCLFEKDVKGNKVPPSIVRTQQSLKYASNALYATNRWPTSDYLSSNMDEIINRIYGLPVDAELLE